jgi:hypothetical protein
MIAVVSGSPGAGVARVRARSESFVQDGNLAGSHKAHLIHFVFPASRYYGRGDSRP